ncbi:hypothetical protein DB30_05138 [Enhygromyxa salina]|uniref:Uncharacterized protein n=1 Tax=Enhygromyxa salina TaxID=215803 RepID=A0A0C2D7E6_9BACT|nr:hypothetical protein DB30_05138 [Enhygromyxa salina]
MFVRHASCFIAMQMVRRLLRELGVAKKTHDEFARARELVTDADAIAALYAEALDDVRDALNRFYGAQDVSRQQLAATI